MMSGALPYRLPFVLGSVGGVSGNGTLAAGIAVRSPAFLQSGGVLTAEAIDKSTVALSGRGNLQAAAAATQFVFTGAFAGRGTLALAVNSDFDSIGNGFTSTATNQGSWFHTASAGAYVLVEVFSRGQPDSVYYGTSSMSTVVSAPVGGGDFYLTFYGLPDAAAGPQEVVVNWPYEVRDVVCNSTSYTGVRFVTATETMSNQYGYVSNHGPITCPSGDIIVQAFAGICTAGGGFYLDFYTGGDARWSSHINQRTSGPTSVMCVAGDSAASTSFSATVAERASYVWASCAATLSSRDSVGSIMAPRCGRRSNTLKQ